MNAIRLALGSSRRRSSRQASQPRGAHGAPARAACIALSGAFLLAGNALAAPPAGYFVDSTQARTARPTVQEEATGDYTFSVRRSAPDSSSLRLLAIAESAYPPRELLVDIAARKGYEMGPDTARAMLWWCEGIGPRRIPYAITAGALEHYIGLIDRYRDRRYPQTGARPVFTSDLVYRATIAPRETFRLGREAYADVYVATLSLAWTYDDGTFRPTLEGRRIVVLARDGALLAVDGDGATREHLAISTRLGVGRQERMSR